MLFTTSALKRLSSEHAELTELYSTQQQSLAKEIISITGTYIPVLEELNCLIAKLDALVSMAFASSLAPVPYVRPNFQAKGSAIIRCAVCVNDSDRRISIVNGRHPCLEQGDSSFIANSIEMREGTVSYILVPYLH